MGSLTNLTGECRAIAGALNGTLTNTLCRLAGASNSIPVLGGLLGSTGLLGQTTSALCPNGLGGGSGTGSNPLSPISSLLGGGLGGVVGGLTGLTSAVNTLSMLEQTAQTEVRPRSGPESS